MSPTEILQQHQIKKTSPRVAIIQVLQKSLFPLTEADIKNEMGDLYDRITFYRSVQTMLEAGIIHRIIVDNVTVKYALNHCAKGHCHHTSHAHFYCRICKEVICLDETEVKANIPEGFLQEELDLLIKGVCKQCNEA
jgi:Fur family ferric uptake transcriptional regulator